MNLTIQDLEAIGGRTLQVFSEGVERAEPDMCWEFNKQVSNLESQAIQLYGIVAILTKKEDDIAKVAEMWDAMTRLVDTFASKLKSLCDQHPFCETSHDTLLDLRNRCSRLRDLHA